MKAFLSVLLLVPFLFAVAQDEDACPPGFEKYIDEDTGEEFCRRITDVCPIGEKPYFDKASNAHLCCKADSQVVIYDEKTNEGVCCGPNQAYAGTPPNGKCCPKGQIFRDGNCVPAPPPSGCQGCPAQPPGACQLKAACGDIVNNGLEFGKCYQILLPNGRQLGRGTSPSTIDTYTQDGYIQNIPYKVCKTTDDCGTGVVKASDNFFMQDLIGPSAGSAAFGWGSELGGSHMTITADPKKAGTFNGKTSCSSCKCVVQLTSLGYACPFDNPGVTFWPNPKVTLKLQFLEIPCSGKFNF
ncbi:hypothetical protein AAF712_014932 [Marasmius tenuissimus]|uniref:Uncharacterized protein n=1 Tax=Marasmius tenuissimus TaxID=585030 RepID=A0ABR2ZAS0_9AGAR